MNKLKFLGRGSAFNTSEGNTSAFYYLDKDHDHIVFIDCGESTFQRIVEKKLLDNVDRIDIFITHLHSDHAGSLGSLIHYCYFVKNICPTIYYGEPDVMRQYLNIIGVLRTEYTMSLDFHNFSFEFIKVPHKENISSFAIKIKLIEEEKVDILYTGDTTKICLPKEGIVYHDTCLNDYPGNVHASLKRLIDKIDVSNRKRVYCMHFDCDETITKAKNAGFNVVELF